MHQHSIVRLLSFTQSVYFLIVRCVVHVYWQEMVFFSHYDYCKDALHLTRQYPGGGGVEGAWTIPRPFLSTCMPSYDSEHGTSCALVVIPRNVQWHWRWRGGGAAIFPCTLKEGRAQPPTFLRHCDVIHTEVSVTSQCSKSDVTCKQHTKVMQIPHKQST